MQVVQKVTDLQKKEARLEQPEGLNFSGLVLGSIRETPLKRGTLLSPCLLMALLKVGPSEGGSIYPPKRAQRILSPI